MYSDLTLNLSSGIGNSLTLSADSSQLKVKRKAVSGSFMAQLQSLALPKTNGMMEIPHELFCSPSKSLFSFGQTPPGLSCG